MAPTHPAGAKIMIRGIAQPHPAVIAIDLHRGHLDPEIATMPLEAGTAARVVAANAKFLRWCRTASIPVFHCVATYRDAEEIGGGAFATVYRAIEVDTGRHRVTIDGAPLAFRPLEYKLITTLLAAPGTIDSRADLMRLVWGIEECRERGCGEDK